MTAVPDAEQSKMEMRKKVLMRNGISLKNIFTHEDRNYDLWVVNVQV